MISLGVSKFRGLLVVSCFSFGMAGLAEIVDSAIAGHILGPVALGAIGLFWPVVELVYFLAAGIGGGSAIHASAAAGSNDDAGRTRVFSNGLFSSLALGGVIAASLGFLRGPILAFFDADAATKAACAAYWNGYLANMALYPLYAYLSTMIAADGDERVPTLAFALAFAADTLCSLFLCQRFGIVGCAWGSTAGTLVGLLVLSAHFFCPANSFRIRPFVSLSLTARVFWLDLSENVNALLATATYSFVAWYLVTSSGPASLPILAVVISAHGLMFFLYGVGAALRPVIALYRAEGDVPAERRVMRDGLRTSFVLGLALGALLVAWPSLPSLIVGMDDPALRPSADAAVRWVGVSFPFYSLAILFVSYYVFIGRRRLSLALVVLLEAVFPIALGYGGHLLGGPYGFWVGYSLAAPLTLACVVLPAFVARRSRAPLYLPDDASSGFCDFMAPVEPKAVCAVAEAVRRKLAALGAPPSVGMRASMLVEETLMFVREMSGDRPCRSEISLDVRDGAIRLILRDDGAICKVSRDAPGIEATRSIVLGSVLENLESRFGYAALGLNRNAFVLREGSPAPVAQESDVKP